MTDAEQQAEPMNEEQQQEEEEAEVNVEEEEAQEEVAAPAGAEEEEGEPQQQEEEAAAAGKRPAEGEADGQPDAKAPKGEPVQIGYKTFTTGREAQQYFHTLATKLRKYQNLNEYEHHMVVELISKGHPEAARKLEGGVKSIQIRDIATHGNITSCFYLLRDGGAEEDVSYRKCIAKLFPEMAEILNKNSSNNQQRSGRGGGRGGGRGDAAARDGGARGSGGRGRGGRGGGRGRGNSRGRGGGGGR